MSSGQRKPSAGGGGRQAGRQAIGQAVKQSSRRRQHDAQGRDLTAVQWLPTVAEEGGPAGGTAARGRHPQPRHPQQADTPNRQTPPTGRHPRQADTPNPHTHSPTTTCASVTARMSPSLHRVSRTLSSGSLPASRLRRGGAGRCREATQVRRRRVQGAQGEDRRRGVQTAPFPRIIDSNAPPPRVHAVEIEGEGRGTQGGALPGPGARCHARHATALGVGNSQHRPRSAVLNHEAVQAHALHAPQPAAG